MLVEVRWWFSFPGSLALLADAGHILTRYALWRCPIAFEFFTSSSGIHTASWLRAEIPLAAFVNAMALGRRLPF